MAGVVSEQAHAWHEHLTTFIAVFSGNYANANGTSDYPQY